MSAIVIDLKDFSVRTPDQIIRVFYALFSCETVREKLLAVFCDHAKLEANGINDLNISTEETAFLFDHLMAFTESIETLRFNVSDGKCEICGRGGEISKPGPGN